MIRRSLSLALLVAAQAQAQVQVPNRPATRDPAARPGQTVSAPDNGVAGEDARIRQIVAGVSAARIEADIRRMAEAGVADPSAVIRSLFDRAGVAYVSASGGTISLR